MERGWVGRVDGDDVIHLAAQTLQHFFTGGASAREHDRYALADVTFLAPVAHPPSVRVFADERSFEFANPAAIAGPDAVVVTPGAGEVVAFPRLAAVVADGAVAGFTGLLELRVPGLPVPKDRDFALATGPVVVTPDEVDHDTVWLALAVDGVERPRRVAPRFDWRAAVDHAASGTTLRTGDLVVGPAAAPEHHVARGSAVSLAVEHVGDLRLTVA